MKCGAYTLKLAKTETFVKALYMRSGKKLETCVCQHCGEVIEKTVTIPKKEHYTSSDGGDSYLSSFSSGCSYSSHSLICLEVLSVADIAAVEDIRGSGDY